MPSCTCKILQLLIETMAWCNRTVRCFFYRVFIPLSLYLVSPLFPEARRAFRMPCPATVRAPRKGDTAAVWIDKRMLIENSFGTAGLRFWSGCFFMRQQPFPGHDCKRGASSFTGEVPAGACMMQNRAGRVRDACQNLCGRGLALVLAGNRQHV